MQEPNGVEARNGDVLLMIGTTKGGFLLRSGPDRDRWEMDGPHFPGSEMYAFALARLTSRGAEVAYVGTGGDAAHAPARRAYEALGFDRIIPSVHYYREL